MRQSVLSGEVDEFFSIVAGEAIVCPQPHNAVWIVVNSADVITRQSMSLDLDHTDEFFPIIDSAGELGIAMP
jgi:hypothetical protein